MMTAGQPLLRVRELKVHFSTGRKRVGGSARVLRAVDGVGFDLHRGETLGLVGESGCGKSSTARAVLRLVEPAGGEVTFDGQDVLAMNAVELRSFRGRAQIVFQDPFGSLNPRMSARAMLEEALKVHGVGVAADRRRRARDLLELVGLRPGDIDRYPHEFSGGQRQRLGIARALSVRPDLVVLDEPVSSLDVSVRAQVINLLRDLQARLGLTYLFIAHDLAVVEHVSDRVAVMYLGRIVESAGAADLWARPRHPYTRALLAAAPKPEPRGASPRERIVLTGDVPSPAAPPSGCPFHPRCPDPRKDQDCVRVTPGLRSVGPGHFSACLKESPEGPSGG